MAPVLQTAVVWVAGVEPLHEVFFQYFPYLFPSSVYKEPSPYPITFLGGEYSNQPPGSPLKKSNLLTDYSNSFFSSSK